MLRQEYVKLQCLGTLENPTKVLKMTKASAISTAEAGRVEVESMERQGFSYPWSEADHSTRRDIRNRVPQGQTPAVGRKDLTETIFEQLVWEIYL